jgi:hypothetical protein
MGTIGLPPPCVGTTASGLPLTIAQNTGYALDMADMERQFWAHWENKGKPDFKKGVAVAFKGFVDRKYRQMKQIRR